MLKEAFFELCGRYADAPKLAEACWVEIASCYSGSKRHYHDLSHLSNLLKWLQEVKGSIHDWDTVLFALYYHDIVYHATKSDNELQSALLAETRMAGTWRPRDPNSGLQVHDSSYAETYFLFGC